MREQYTGTHVSHCVWPPHDDVRTVNGGGRATYDSLISAGDSGVGGVCGSVLGSVAHDMARVTSRAVLVASTSNVATPFTPVLHCTHVSSRNSGAPKPSASRAQCRCSARCSSCTRLYDAMEDFLSFVFSGQQAPIWLFRFSRLTPYQAGKPPPRMSNHVVNNNNSSIHHPKFWSRKRKRHREIGSSNFWSPTPVETL